MNNEKQNWFKRIWNNKLMAFFGMPLIFVVLGYLLVFGLCRPVLSPLMNVLDLFIGTEVPDFNTDMTSAAQPDFSNAAVSEGSVWVGDITLPQFDEVYGRLRIDNRGVDAPLYYGDSNAALRRGVGQYTGSTMPGFGSTTLIAGHVNTFFRGLETVEVGDIITLQTTYGVYTYRVTQLRVLDADDPAAYDLSAKQENLVLYTCYPFGILGFTRQRYFVNADYVSGPKVDIQDR